MNNKMNISELPCDDKIKITKFNFSCDCPDDTIPDPLPKVLNFFMLICGRPGSGKTTLILNLICKRGKMYNKKFDKIYLFSPSLSTMENNPFENLPEEQVFSGLSVENLERVLGDIAGSGEKVLFILDDVVNDIKKSAQLQNTLTRMLMNRRHLAGSGGSTSFIITTQVYNKLVAPIRKTASHIIIYHTRNKKELETIYDELIVIPLKQFYQILQYVFGKRNDFLLISVNNNYDKMFYKNFNQLVFPSVNELGI